MDKRGGVSRFSVKNFVSHSAERFVGEPFNMSLVWGIEKIYASGLCQDFLSKIFCLTVPKHFVEERFCAVFQKNSGNEKGYGKEGGEYQDFPSKIFCLTVPKNSVGESFNISLI